MARAREHLEERNFYGCVVRLTISSGTLFFGLSSPCTSYHIVALSSVVIVPLLVFDIVAQSYARAGEVMRSVGSNFEQIFSLPGSISSCACNPCRTKVYTPYTKHKVGLLLPEDTRWGCEQLARGRVSRRGHAGNSGAPLSRAPKRRGVPVFPTDMGAHGRFPLIPTLARDSLTPSSQNRPLLRRHHHHRAARRSAKGVH